MKNQYEKKYNRHIPHALKCMTARYTENIIKSTSLTTKEDLELFTILNKKLSCNIKEFKLLYRGSENDFSAKKFHDKCDGKKLYGTITIILSEYGNVFCGYTQKPWNNEEGFFWNDDKAFLTLNRCMDDVSINDKCPLIFELKNQEEELFAICADDSYGPIFGGGYDIRIADKCNEKKVFSNGHHKSRNYTCVYSYYNSEFGDDRALCGGQTSETYWNRRKNQLYFLFDVKEYEVFEVIGA